MIEVQDPLRMRLSRRELLKYSGAVLTASALGGLLVACGGDDDDDDEEDPTATTDDQAQDDDPTATEEDDEPTATEEEEEPTEEPTDEPEPTATDEPEPTATEEPEPTATEEPPPTNTPEPEPTATEEPPEPQTHTVNMTDDFIFDPPQISINVGDTIVWMNVGAAPHTATCDPNLAMDPASVNLPDGAAPWDTGIINEGESASHTFDTPGEYTYFCIPHEAIGMIAQISVAG